MAQGVGGGGGGVLGLIFAGYVLLASQSPYPMKNYSVMANYRTHLIRHILTYKANVINFCDPNLVTFCLCICLIQPFN